MSNTHRPSKPSETGELNNPPAFPVPIKKINFDTNPRDFTETHCEGMTLRDYFAARFAQSAIAAIAGKSHSVTEQAIVADAYSMADAMLEGRAK